MHHGPPPHQNRHAIHPAKDGVQIELMGEIVRMVELGLNNKEAALPKEAACSVKVVAGAGFPPCRTQPARDLLTSMAA